MKQVTVPIEVSARHVHLTEAHCKKLFGRGLTRLKLISQTGQFAAVETVTLKEQGTGNKEQKSRFKLRVTSYELRDVRVVGPARKESQVELSLSDCHQLGLHNVPLKVSGSLAGTPGITVVGPKGKVVLKRGVIVAQRHIHCPTEKARSLGLKNGQIVRVAVKGKRAVVFENVVVRVLGDYVFRMHVDTDEANAAGIDSNSRGVIIR